MTTLHSYYQCIYYSKLTISQRLACLIFAEGETPRKKQPLWQRTEKHIKKLFNLIYSHVVYVEIKTETRYATFVVESRC